MNNIKKLLEIEKSLNKEGTEIISTWLLRKNGWIYLHRNTEEERQNILNLLDTNNIKYNIKNNQIGEILYLSN